MTRLSTNQEDSMRRGSQKLVKLNYLLQNSKTSTITGGTQIHETVSNSEDFLTDLSKDFSLHSFLKKESTLQERGSLSLVPITCNGDQGGDKPINLLFSLDQFVFEFSKKTYQQKKSGEFFQQLKERKKLSLFYGHLTRKQLVHLVDKVKKYKGYFSKNFFSLLEQRLDVVLYRSGITKTVAEARQLIKHKKIRVNKSFTNVPSLRLHPGDFLSMMPETATLSASELLKGVKPQSSPRYPRIFEDFYSKFRRAVEKSSQKPSHQGLDSGVFCNVLIQSLCTEMKLRCFWNLEKNANEISTLFKWKSFSHRSMLSQKEFSGKKPSFSKLKGQKKKPLKNTSVENSLYFSNHPLVCAGSWKKKPVFFCRDFMSFKQNQNLQVQNKKTGQLHEKQQRDKKNMKSLNLQKNLALYRKSFLLFLKHLETHKKFTSLVALNLKKYLFKRCFYKHKSLFSRTLSFRVTKPLHIEVSYNLLNLIYLYSPQRVNFPFLINLDLIFRSLR